MREMLTQNQVEITDFKELEVGDLATFRVFGSDHEFTDTVWSPVAHGKGRLYVGNTPISSQTLEFIEAVRTAPTAPYTAGTLIRADRYRRFPNGELFFRTFSGWVDVSGKFVTEQDFYYRETVYEAERIR